MRDCSHTFRFMSIMRFLFCWVQSVNTRVRVHLTTRTTWVVHVNECISANCLPRALNLNYECAFVCWHTSIRELGSLLPPQLRWHLLTTIDLSLTINTHNINTDSHYPPQRVFSQHAISALPTILRAGNQPGCLHPASVVVLFWVTCCDWSRVLPWPVTCVHVIFVSKWLHLNVRATHRVFRSKTTFPKQ